MRNGIHETYTWSSRQNVDGMAQMRPRQRVGEGEREREGGGEKQTTVAFLAFIPEDCFAFSSFDGFFFAMVESVVSVTQMRTVLFELSIVEMCGVSWSRTRGGGVGGGEGTYQNGILTSHKTTRHTTHTYVGTYCGQHTQPPTATCLPIHPLAHHDRAHRDQNTHHESKVWCGCGCVRRMPRRRGRLLRVSV